MKTVRKGAGRKRNALPQSGTSCRTTFLRGQKRWAHSALTKEEKQVKDREVVVRHGGGDEGLPLKRRGALKDTLALAKTLHNCLEEQKKMLSSVGRRLSGGGRHGGQKS